MKRMLVQLAIVASIQLLAGCSWDGINHRDPHALKLALASPSPAPLSRFIAPTVDLTLQGGSAVMGSTTRFKVTQVAIGGSLQRIQSQTPSGLSIQAGPPVVSGN